jgi:hypothetical protein
MSATLTEAVHAAVVSAGGDEHDERDLLDVWARLAADGRGRLSRLRFEVANRPCRCGDAPELATDGRCGRCYGARLDDDNVLGAGR